MVGKNHCWNPRIIQNSNFRMFRCRNLFQRKRTYRWCHRRNRSQFSKTLRLQIPKRLARINRFIMEILLIWKKPHRRSRIQNLIQSFIIRWRNLHEPQRIIKSFNQQRISQSRHQLKSWSHRSNSKQYNNKLLIYIFIFNNNRF